MSRIRSCSGGCQSLSPDIHQNNKGPGVFINHQGHVTEHRHFGLGQVRTYHNIFAEGYTGPASHLKVSWRLVWT